MRNNIFTFLLAVSFVSILYCQNDLGRIPYGKNILANGIIETEEWKDSKQRKLTEDISLYIKQDTQYIYIALEFLKEKHTGIDLYVGTSNNNIWMLHTSSTLSDRKYENNKWSDSRWILQSEWTSNTVGIFMNDKGERSTIEPSGFEYQIKKSTLSSDTFYIRCHLKRPEKILPINIIDTSVVDWLKFRL